MGARAQSAHLAETVRDAERRRSEVEGRRQALQARHSNLSDRSDGALEICQQLTRTLKEVSMTAETFERERNEARTLSDVL